MKFSKKFERDFRWYLSMRHTYDFDGSSTYTNKKGESIITFNKNGVSGKEAFYVWDSEGKILPTKHPNLLHTLLKVKGSTNFHIKMYAEGRVDGTLPLCDITMISLEYNFPEWIMKSIENLKKEMYTTFKIPSEYFNLKL